MLMFYWKMLYNVTVQVGIFGTENTVWKSNVCSFGQFSCEALPKTVTVHICEL